MKKILLRAVSGLLLLSVVAAGIAWYQAFPNPPKRQLFVNGVVLTMDAENTVASALLVEGERIAAVGESEALLRQHGDSAEVHDLQGRALIPGFVDAHGHFPGSGLSVLGVDLSSPPVGAITSMQALSEAVRAKAKDTPTGDWVFGFGYDDTLLAEMRHPTRAELDAISTEHPIYVWHVSGHMGVANSRALEIAGMNRDTPNPEGGVIERDAQGELTGLLQETAAVEMQRHAMQVGPLEFLRMVRHAARDYAAQGVTTAQNGGTDTLSYRALSLASALHLIPMRLEIWPLWDELGQKLLDGTLRREDMESDRLFVGPVKFFTDGSIQGYTGFLSHAYHTPYHGDADYRGYPVIEQAKLQAALERYQAAGLQLALHTNGDAAIDNTLDAIEAAQHAHPRPDMRHILVHAQMSRHDQIARMAALGVTPSFFSAHTYYWGDRHRDIFIGPERAANISPTRWAREAGVRFSVHLDTPVVPMRPTLLWWSTVNRLTSSGRELGPAQRLNVMETLRAMTADAAWQVHLDDRLGSLEPGKLADLVVLDRDPRQSPETLNTLRVERTLVGGTTIYQRRDGE